MQCLISSQYRVYEISDPTGSTMSAPVISSIYVGDHPCCGCHAIKSYQFAIALLITKYLVNILYIVRLTHYSMHAGLHGYPETFSRDNIYYLC